MAPGDIALLDTLDDWTVHVPGHPDEAEALLRRAAAAGDDRVYVRLSVQVNARAQAGGRGGLPDAAAGASRRRGGRRRTDAGPGARRDRGAGRDGAVRDDRAPLRRRRRCGPRPRRPGPDVVLVEPYLAGTSTRFANEALEDRPHRVLGLGVGPPGAAALRDSSTSTWRRTASTRGACAGASRAFLAARPDVSGDRRPAAVQMCLSSQASRSSWTSSRLVSLRISWRASGYAFQVRSRVPR